MLPTRPQKCNNCLFSMDVDYFLIPLYSGSSISTENCPLVLSFVTVAQKGKNLLDCLNHSTILGYIISLLYAFYVEHVICYGEYVTWAQPKPIPHFTSLELCCELLCITFSWSLLLLLLGMKNICSSPLSSKVATANKPWLRPMEAMRRRLMMMNVLYLLRYSPIHGAIESIPT